MKPTPDLTICLINHNRCRLTIACIESILSNSGDLKLEIILVNNTPEDGCTTIVRTRFPDIVILENAEPKTFGENSNLALVRAHGRHVLFLNNDTLVNSDALGAMVAFLDCRPDVGAVSVTLTSLNGTVQPVFQGQVSLRTELRRHLVDLNVQGLLSSGGKRSASDNTPCEVTNISGACFCARHSVLAQVGGFDENFRFYYEDVDLSQRIRKSGFRLYCLPAETIVHLGGETLAGSALSVVNEFESASLFLRKHCAMGNIGYLALKIGFTANTALRAAMYLLLSIVQGKKALYRSAMYFRVLAWHLGIKKL